MDNMDNDSAALEQILGDMDSMEGKRVYGDKPESAPSGVSITIDVAPKGDDSKKDEEYPEGHDIKLCKGGCAYHKGGEVPMPDEDESGMPPFLRKRK